MENKEVIKALRDIYLFSDLDDEEALDTFLNEKDIDFENFTNQLEEKVKHKRAELLKEKGRKFRYDYYKLLAYLSLSHPKLEIDIIEDKSPALAYRKKADGDIGPDDLEATKLELIRKAKESQEE